MLVCRHKTAGRISLRHIAMQLIRKEGKKEQANSYAGNIASDAFHHPQSREYIFGGDTTRYGHV